MSLLYSVLQRLLYLQICLTQTINNSLYNSKLVTVTTLSATLTDYIIPCLIFNAEKIFAVLSEVIIIVILTNIYFYTPST